LDHLHEKLDIQDDYTEFIKHVKTKINIESYGDNATLPKEVGHADATLPERIRKLIFNLYSITIHYINYSGYDCTTFIHVD